MASPPQAARRNLLVGDIFTNAARAVPNRLAVAAGMHRLTFGELDRQANRIARALAGVGVGTGDRIAVWADSAIDLAPVFAGTAKSGAVFAPLNGRLGLDEATPIAQLARPALLVVDADRAAAAPKLAATLGVPWLLADTVTGGRGDGDRSQSLAALAGDRQDDDPGTPLGLTEHGTHVVFFTSGSTGKPKGVVISHRVSVLRSHPGGMLEPRGALICPFPLFHMAGWTLGLSQWHGRDALVLTAPTDGAAICAAVEEHRATRMYLIPAVWRRVLDHLATPAGPHHDLSSVRFADTGTSATPLPLLEEIAAAVPSAVLRVFYGSTEAGNVASLEHIDVRSKPGSCGVPSPLTEVRRAESGELQVRNAIMFDGYFDNPEATAAAFENGWFRTGDRVDVDADGYLTITGRTTDLIRTGGEAVSPSEVEAALATHPQISDVAVVGLPDPVWGEVVCACVVARAGAALTLEDLRAHCASLLATHKHPRRLLLADHIPRTAATMQVQRTLLVELATTSATA